MAAFDQLKEANPKGRFWLKLDATDLKEAIMESVKGVWNGDVDLGDGKLQELREKYESSLNLLNGLSSYALLNLLNGLSSYNSGRELEVGLQQWIDRLEEDVIFLDSGYKEAVAVYTKKYNNPSTADEALKNANWDVVEYQTVLQQSQTLKQAYEAELSHLNPAVMTPQDLRAVKASVRGLASDAKTYLRNIFKKRRTAATHVLVLMLSDERRSKKPYALPVRFIPYRNLRDQYVRDFTREIKQHMTERGLALVGM